MVCQSCSQSKKLVLQVKAQLQDTHALPIWAAQEAESSISLPSFNAYPQLSVTAAGEYLMMLPQMLESLLIESEEGVDTEWLDKVGFWCSRIMADCSLLTPDAMLSSCTVRSRSIQLMA